MYTQQRVLSRCRRLQGPAAEGEGRRRQGGREGEEGAWGMAAEVRRARARGAREALAGGGRLGRRVRAAPHGEASVGPQLEA